MVSEIFLTRCAIVDLADSILVLIQSVDEERREMLRGSFFLFFFEGMRFMSFSLLQSNTLPGFNIMKSIKEDEWTDI